MKMEDGKGRLLYCVQEFKHMNKKYKQYLKKIKHFFVNDSVYSRNYSVTKGWFFVIFTTIVLTFVFLVTGLYVFLFIGDKKIESDIGDGVEKTLFDSVNLNETLSEYEERVNVFKNNIDKSIDYPKVNDRVDFVYKENIDEEVNAEDEIDENEKIELSP